MTFFYKYFVNLTFTSPFRYRIFMLGTKNFSDGVILASGYKSSSEWYAFYNSSSQCVRKLTGMDGFVMFLILFLCLYLW